MSQRAEVLARGPSSLSSRSTPAAGGAEERAPFRTPTAHALYFERPVDDERLRARLEDAFFNDIWVRYGTSKTTCHHRLDDLNGFVQPLLPMGRPLDIMDVAVSSGISTVEWMQSLERAGISCSMVAGDAVVDTFLLSIGTLARALVDRTGYLMQLDLGGRSIRLPPPRRLTRLRFLPAIALVRGLASVLRPVLDTLHATGSEARRWGVTCRPVKLVSPTLLAQPGIEIVEDDISRSRNDRRRFHVIRAANILNRGYFDAHTLQRMLLNLRARLRAGGLLIVCRTMPDGRNNATVFRFEERRFRVVAVQNDGSEVTDIVLALNTIA